MAADELAEIGLREVARDEPRRGRVDADEVTAGQAAERAARSAAVIAREGQQLGVRGPIQIPQSQEHARRVVERGERGPQIAQRLRARIRRAGRRGAGGRRP